MGVATTAEPLERPFFLVVDAARERRSLLVPLLEQEHMKKGWGPGAQEVLAYAEFPAPAGQGWRDALVPLSALEAYEPRIFVYDNYPGGIGMSEPLFRVHDRLLSQARALIAACPCAHGCPSCTGPVGETGHFAKEVANAILEAIATA